MLNKHVLIFLNFFNNVPSQWAKSPKKYFECQININALLQTVFSAILLIGLQEVKTALFGR